MDLTLIRNSGMNISCGVLLAGLDDESVIIESMIGGCPIKRYGVYLPKVELAYVFPTLGRKIENLQSKMLVGYVLILVDIADMWRGPDLLSI
jgi:hypothetical protein